MAFPTKLLSAGEEMILDLRPHWVALVGPAILTILLVAAEIVVSNAIPDDWPDWVRLAALGLGLLVFLAYPLRLLARWLTTHFVLTNERVIHRSGFFAKQAMELPLERVNDVRFHQSFIERLLGAGDLVIETGGEYGQQHFSDIRKPESVQKQIYEAYEKSIGRVLPDPIQPGESEVAQLERLAALKEKGHLTPEEFEAKKRRILET